MLAFPKETRSCSRSCWYYQRKRPFAMNGAMPRYHVTRRVWSGARRFKSGVRSAAGRVKLGARRVRSSVRSACRMFVAPSFGAVLTKQPHEFIRRDEYSNIKQQTVWRSPGRAADSRTRAATPGEDIPDDTCLAQKTEHNRRLGQHLVCNSFCSHVGLPHWDSDSRRAGRVG